MQDAIYAKTRSMLETVDMSSSDSGPCHIEHIQSWILITFYEFAKTNYRRAWLSAGRVFRLVQFTKLHDLDSPKPPGSETTEDAVSLEEKRRTFWVAYYLDGLISLSEGAPLTLNEDSVFTRLPCPDADIQSGLIRQESFLLEAMSSADPRHYSPLAECAILVTIYGRTLSHKQATALGSMYSSTPLDVCARHDWLDGILTRRLNSLEVNYPSTSLTLDPMIVFSYMIAYSAIIYMCGSIETMSRNEQNRALVWQFQERGLWAAQEITRLASEHQHLGCFKAHTFMPLAIYLGASRLGKHLVVRAGELDSKAAECIEKSRQASLEALQKLKCVNHLADHYCQLLELG